jgi:hypothetical protein
VYNLTIQLNTIEEREKKKTVKINCRRQLSTPTVDANCRHQLSTPTVDTNCRHQLSTPPTVDANCRHQLSTPPTVDANCRHQLSTPTVDANCRHQLSTPTVDANCRPHQLSTPTVDANCRALWGGWPATRRAPRRLCLLEALPLLSPSPHSPSGPSGGSPLPDGLALMASPPHDVWKPRLIMGSPRRPSGTCRLLCRPRTPPEATRAAGAPLQVPGAAGARGGEWFHKSSQGSG